MGRYIRNLVLRPAMMYGFDTWALKNLDAVEMRMVRLMSGVTKRGRIRNKRSEFNKSGRNIQESAGKQVTSSLSPPWLLL